MEKKKLVFQLDTPYSTATWPQVDFEDQDTILELLCTLLSPLSHYRSRHIKSSKGKRDKKRKCKEAGETPIPSPPAPDISSYVDIGLTSVTRRLQDAALKGSNVGSDLDSGKSSASEDSNQPYYSAIFVARSGQPSIMNSHLPQMVAVASESHLSRQPIQLVGLSKACQDRLSESVGIPRVSCIGLREGAPGTKPLVDLVRQRVPTIEVPWLKEAQKPEYKKTKISAIETVVGAKKAGKK